MGWKQIKPETEGLSKIEPMAPTAMIGVIFILICVSMSMVIGKIIMERQIPRESFVRLNRSPPNWNHEVVIAMQKKNMDYLEEAVLQRASPESAMYQQWMTYEEVGRIIENIPAFERVRDWLLAKGIKITWVSNRRDYIKASAPIHQWEDLLHTQFYEHEDRSIPLHKLHKNTHNRVHRAYEYSLPSQLLSDDVYAILNTVQTPPAYQAKFQVKESSEFGAPFKTDIIIHPPPKSSHLRGMDGQDGTSEATQSIDLDAAGGVVYDGYVTVAFLNSYYHVSNNTGNAAQSQSVFETSTQYFSTADLTEFQQRMNLRIQPAQSIGNHQTNSCPVTSTATKDCYEGNLDIQYIMGVSQVTASIFWWVSGATTDPFVGWVTAMADETDPPKSNSASWGANEQAESVAILTTFNNEALQLAAMGVTIFASTGDNGVANLNSTNGCQCQANSASSTTSWTGSNSWTGSGYFPQFPATSPYVTAAGATMGPETGDPEIACQSQLGGVITTGGGFSTYFAAPSWQKKTTARYLSRLSGSSVPTAGYNSQGRGIPDVSLIGSNYLIVVGSSLQVVFGTSCTSPVLAAFVSLINAGRLSENKTSIGWLNPTLYSVGYNNSLGLSNRFGHSAAFNDITSGHNKCCANGLASKAVCCASGFTATTGWDPVTGWGSVNFTALAAMFDYFPTNTTSSNSGGTTGGGSSNGSGSKGLQLAGLSPSMSIAVLVFIVLVALAISTAICCYCTFLVPKEMPTLSYVRPTVVTWTPPEQELTRITTPSTRMKQDQLQKLPQQEVPDAEESSGRRSSLTSKRSTGQAKYVLEDPKEEEEQEEEEERFSQRSTFNNSINSRDDAYRPAVPSRPAPPPPPPPPPPRSPASKINLIPPPPTAPTSPAPPSATAAGSDRTTTKEVLPEDDLHYEQEADVNKVRINMANPMRNSRAIPAYLGSSRLSSSQRNSDLSGSDRNSMDRIAHLQRGLSMDHPGHHINSINGNRSHLLSNQRPEKPARPPRFAKPDSTNPDNNYSHGSAV